MSVRESYKQGTPNWIDLATPNPQAAKEFYGKFMGWEFEDSELPQGGEYSMACCEGKAAAGIMQQQPQATEAGAPPAWNTYIAVDDVADTCSKAEACGGRVVMPPQQVMESGEMAVLADPSGAMFGIWKANNHIGCEVVNQDSALIWNELVCDNIDKAAPFYAEALGIDVKSEDMPSGDKYTTFNVDGRAVGGTMAPQAEGIPNHWSTYFCVDDVDACVDKCCELGGSCLAPAFDVEGVGRMAAVADPQGAAFMLMKPANPPQD